MNAAYFIRRARRLHSNRIAIACGDTSFTAGEVLDRAARLANALGALGCEPGARVAVLLPNCTHFMEIEFACALSGFARVALNYRLPGPDLLRTLEKMEADALIYAGRHEELAAQAAGRRPGLRLLRLTLGEEDEGDGAGAGYERLLSKASGKVPDPPLGPETLYSIFCTSGTTGDPKGVMLTHRAQLAVATGLVLELGPVRPGGSILLAQPLSHGAGFFVLPYFMAGATCVVAETFDPVGTFETAVRHRVETLKVVPTMLIQMLQAGVAPTRDYSPSHIVYGAAPMPREWLLEGMNVFGPQFAQLYGQAEAPMCITVLAEEDHADPDSEILESAGRPWRNVEVRVVDEAGDEVPAGERGEVIVRGDHITSGYWGDPEQSDRVLRDGYVHTRDLATVDERGYVYLLGRMDEMINSGGFNIAPRTVERVLHAHESILEAAVIGVPDPVWGEAVKAFVVLRDGNRLSSEDIYNYCKPRLGMQLPRAVEFVEALPKNAYGKVQKSALRQP